MKPRGFFSFASSEVAASADSFFGGRAPSAPGLQKLNRGKMEILMKGRVYSNIAEAIGQTPLVKLNKVTAGIKAEVYAKIEYVNPGGSNKDRIALSMIDDAEKSGKLKVPIIAVSSTR
jgi:hypothetical protein